MRAPAAVRPYRFRVALWLSHYLPVMGGFTGGAWVSYLVPFSGVSGNEVILAEAVAGTLLSGVGPGAKLIALETLTRVERLRSTLEGLGRLLDGPGT